MAGLLGVIGGSGVYEIEGLTARREITATTPFGPPSDTLVAGELAGQAVVFLPRHGRGHRLAPAELNHRANIFALKQVGVECIISISAVGSLKEEYRPGDIVLVDQYLDRTKQSAGHTFFGGGVVAHVGFAQPTCLRLGAHLGTTLAALLAAGNPRGVRVHHGGTYVNMEGPAFSTLAESRLYRTWGMDVIGMTNLGEAKLAREAEICYQTVAMVTDYDCWHQTHESVSVEMIIKTLLQNADLAKQMVARAAVSLPDLRECSCRRALAQAIVTAPTAIPQELRQRLAPIIGKYLPAQ